VVQSSPVIPRRPLRSGGCQPGAAVLSQDQGLLPRGQKRTGFRGKVQDYGLTEVGFKIEEVSLPSDIRRCHLELPGFDGEPEPRVRSYRLENQLPLLFHECGVAPGNLTRSSHGHPHGEV
jgi:hypothetical protein